MRKPSTTAEEIPLAEAKENLHTATKTKNSQM